MASCSNHFDQFRSLLYRWLSCLRLPSSPGRRTLSPVPFPPRYGRLLALRSLRLPLLRALPRWSADVVSLSSDGGSLGGVAGTWGLSGAAPTLMPAMLRVAKGRVCHQRWTLAVAIPSRLQSSAGHALAGGLPGCAGGCRPVSLRTGRPVSTMTDPGLYLGVVLAFIVPCWRAAG